MSERYGFSDEIAWVDDGDLVTVLRLADLAAPPLLLDSSASAIWRVLEGDGSINEIADQVALAFDVEDVVVREDVARLIGVLVELRVVKVTAMGGPA